MRPGSTVCTTQVDCPRAGRNLRAGSHLDDAIATDDDGLIGQQRAGARIEQTARRAPP